MRMKKQVKSSIWGKEDPETLALLRKERIRGVWLNLAAGDGRYNTLLLKKADKVVASDIDEKALKKLYYSTPPIIRKKLSIVTFDLTKKFPFKARHFDGVFCTGTLHLLPQAKLRHTIQEMTRVLKPHGKLIIDFAADIKRTLPSGKQHIIGNEPQYTLRQARAILKKLLVNFNMKVYESAVPEETIITKGRSYVFSCDFLLVVGKKQ